jgi:hypothetical protein
MNMPANRMLKHGADPKCAENQAELFDVAKALFEMICQPDMPLRFVTDSKSWRMV